MDKDFFFLLVECYLILEIGFLLIELSDVTEETLRVTDRNEQSSYIPAQFDECIDERILVRVELNKIQLSASCTESEFLKMYGIPFPVSVEDTVSL